MGEPNSASYNTEHFANMFVQMENAGRGDRFDLACGHCAHLIAGGEKLRGEIREALDALNEGRIVDVIRILSDVGDT